MEAVPHLFSRMASKSSIDLLVCSGGPIRLLPRVDDDLFPPPLVLLLDDVVRLPKFDVETPLSSSLGTTTFGRRFCCCCCGCEGVASG